MSRNRPLTNAIMVVGSGELPGKSVGAAEIKRRDRARGLLDIGVHIVIRRDGTQDAGRPLDTIGAFDDDRDQTTVYVMLVEGKGITPTASQQFRLDEILQTLRTIYPSAEVLFQG